MATRNLYPTNFQGPLPPGGAYSQLPSVQSDTRNLEFNSSNPGEILNRGQIQAQGVGAAAGDDLQGVMDLLREQQRFGQNKVYSGQREQVDRGSAPLPSELSSMQLSPSQILGYKRGEQAAIEPTIGGARDLVNEAKGLLEDYKRTQESKQKQASDFISSALESGGSAAIEQLLMTSPELFKAAGYGTKEFQAILPGIKAMEKKKESSQANVLLDNERALLSLYTSNPIVKEFNEVQSRKLQVDNIIKSGVGGPADLALVYTFMKALDPSSVVRETEYETARKSGNIFSGIFAKFNGYFKEEGGFLPANVQREFQNLVNQSYKAREDQYSNWRSKIGDIATRQGLNPENVAVDFSSFVDSGNTGNTGNTSGKLPFNQASVAKFRAEVKRAIPNISEEDLNQQIEQKFYNASPTSSTGSSNRTVASSGGMRTDRHNNPTAFTTDVAKIAGLREGVDYVVGDPFPNNSKLKTARLLGDPVDQTIKVIDRIGFYTQSGKPRWTYVNSIPDAKRWSSLTYEQKKRVIGQMYQKEGGTRLASIFKTNKG